jgi:hypothetical protein
MWAGCSGDPDQSGRVVLIVGTGCSADPDQSGRVVPIADTTIATARTPPLQGRRDGGATAAHGSEHATD